MGMKHFLFTKIQKWQTKKSKSFSIQPILNIFFQKFQGFALGFVGLIHAKGIDVAQPLWL